MDRITVYNNLGQLVYKSELTGITTFKLNTASFENGVYIIKLVTIQGVISQRIVVVN
ncbi:MAG: hypothetical protein DRP93_04010 [Candidatus Neomarinimicrobiota bacterium]|nr:MAG: hypothetical protein DRP93_04010 [Candidatus Neomarinimicrobiota bacterium]